MTYGQRYLKYLFKCQKFGKRKPRNVINCHTYVESCEISQQNEKNHFYSEIAQIWRTATLAIAYYNTYNYTKLNYILIRHRNPLELFVVFRFLISEFCSYSLDSNPSTRPHTRVRHKYTRLPNSALVFNKAYCIIIITYLVAL